MKFTAIAALLALAACTDSRMAQPFETMAATETTFSAQLPDRLIYDPFGGQAQRYQAAVRAAEENCRRHGRTARLISDTQGDFSGRRLAFACEAR